jgi:hypothetical protein
MAPHIARLRSLFAPEDLPGLALSRFARALLTATGHL